MNLYYRNKGEKRYSVFLENATPGQIAEQLTQIGTGYGVGRVAPEDLAEGGAWGCAPDGWTETKPYYFDTPTARVGGFVSMADALRGMAEASDGLYRIESQ